MRLPEMPHFSEVWVIDKYSIINTSSVFELNNIYNHPIIYYIPNREQCQSVDILVENKSKQKTPIQAELLLSESVFFYHA